MLPSDSRTKFAQYYVNSIAIRNSACAAVAHYYTSLRFNDYYAPLVIARLKDNNNNSMLSEPSSEHEFVGRSLTRRLLNCS